MNTVLHRAATRGQANHGWVNSNHTFSFGSYYDPMRVHFGALRVLNDDIVQGGKGFGTHSHDNMEIISIPLSGELEHKDSMGNVAIIHENDVQIMSAGTGIAHSEFNKSSDVPVSFLQIWVFPKLRDISPRYDQKTFAPEDRQNKFQVIVAPEKEEGGIVINQDAWFSLGKFEKDKKASYALNMPGNGVYAFVIEGDITVNGQTLHKRDGYGVWDVETLYVESNSRAELLLMEVPMN